LGISRRNLAERKSALDIRIYRRVIVRCRRCARGLAERKSALDISHRLANNESTLDVLINGRVTIRISCRPSSAFTSGFGHPDCQVVVVVYRGTGSCDCTRGLAERKSALDICINRRVTVRHRSGGSGGSSGVRPSRLFMRLWRLLHFHVREEVNEIGPRCGLHLIRRFQLDPDLVGSLSHCVDVLTLPHEFGEVGLDHRGLAMFV